MATRIMGRKMASELTKQEIEQITAGFYMNNTMGPGGTNPSWSGSGPEQDDCMPDDSAS